MRFVLGPTFDSLVEIPGGKLDPTPDFLGVEGSEARYRVNPYSLDESNRLDEIRVYLIPSGTDGFASADDLVASPHPFAAVDVSSFQSGVTVGVPLPSVDPGSYLGQTVYGYQS